VALIGNLKKRSDYRRSRIREEVRDAVRDFIERLGAPGDGGGGARVGLDGIPVFTLTRSYEVRNERKKEVCYEDDKTIPASFVVNDSVAREVVTLGFKFFGASLDQL